MRRLAGGLLLLLHAGCCDDPGARGPGTRLGEAWRPGVDAVERSLLLYVKLPKCASSTTGGVARRVAARHGLVGARKTGKHHCPPPDASAVPCGPFRNGQQVWANHMKLREAILHVPSPLERRVFLFTVVRDPMARAVSNYLHFGVTRKHKPHNDSDIGAYLLGMHDGPLVSYASPGPGDAPARLLATYDLVGTVELYDETMTLLKGALGVPPRTPSTRASATAGEYEKKFRPVLTVPAAS
ncbi:hypothetical protein SO694_00016359 [Aureococcus anophagefferens]|uniref:Sulfotransferase domain-containing protein n=1 Tax=Aureococcus anophagefferens TaxID=44056 RepID=A0ABR1G200_AURAN